MSLNDEDKHDIQALVANAILSYDKQMRERRGDDELSIGWGDKRLYTKGLAVIVLTVFLVLGWLIWAGSAVSSREHRELVNSHNVGNCLATMSPSQKESAQQSLKALPLICPWVSQEGLK